MKKGKEASSLINHSKEWRDFRVKRAVSEQFNEKLMKNTQSSITQKIVNDEEKECVDEGDKQRKQWPKNRSLQRGSRNPAEEFKCQARSWCTDHVKLTSSRTRKATLNLEKVKDRLRQNRGTPGRTSERKKYGVLSLREHFLRKTQTFALSGKEKSILPDRQDGKLCPLDDICR